MDNHGRNQSKGRIRLPTRSRNVAGMNVCVAKNTSSSAVHIFAQVYNQQDGKEIRPYGNEWRTSSKRPEDAKKIRSGKEESKDTQKASYNGEEDEKITFMTMLSPPSDSDPTCKLSRNLVVSTQD
jgi:hypothetical protein